MSKIHIVYGSQTGNTKSIAEMLESELTTKGHIVNCKDASEVPARNLAEGYDCILLGTSVWGIDSIELQMDFETYSDSFGEMGLSGKKCAAFASGDMAYDCFCGGVDFIEEEYRKFNANIITEGLRVEGDAESNSKLVKEFAEKIAKFL